ncbi:MAG: hypothetical protein JNM76_01655 [Betaproteobacteria bacterium]|nr:hypothetical protein [Betaproteobacteria bacterium]
MEIPSTDPALLCGQAVLTARGGDTRVGLQLAQRAYRLARADGDPRTLMLALNAMALCQLTAGRNIEAASTAIDAFRLAEKLDNRLGAMHALTTLLGASNHMYDSLSDTLGMLERALAIAREEGDLALVVRVHNAWGVALGLMGHQEEADVELVKALELAPMTDRSTPPSMIVTNRAYMAVTWARAHPADAQAVDLARSRLDDALRVADEEESNEARIRARYCLGMFRHDQKDLTGAVEALESAIQLAVTMHHHTRSVDARLELVPIQLALEDITAAFGTLDAACMEADLIRPSRQLQVVCAQLADLHARQGDAAKSDEWRRRAETETASFAQERAAAASEINAFWAELERYWPA